MATIATIADVLEVIETDLSDQALQRLLDTAEQDVRDYSTKTQRATLPVIVWDTDYVLQLGQADGTITVPSLGSYPYVRFEGTVGADADSFVADTSQLRTAGSGTDTIIPVTDGGAVMASAFVVTANTERTELTIDASGTTEPVTITRILGICTVEPPIGMRSAVIDLVKLAVEYDILQSERVGQFSEVKKDYHNERYKVLKRLVFASKGSLVA